MTSLIVALYIRISTAEQNADLQERELREYAAARGWTVAIIYSEVGSGADASRKQLANLMSDARARKFQAVLVWKLDRFGRSWFHCLQNVQQLAEIGVRFVSVTQSLLDVDPNSPQGQLVLGIFALVADFERSLIKERTAAGRKRYMEDMAKGRVGKTVQSLSAKNLPIGRPKRIFDRDAVFKLREENPAMSVRAIAKQLGVGKMTVDRVLKGAKS